MLINDPNWDAIKGHCSDGYTETKEKYFEFIMKTLFSKNHFYNYIDLTAGRGLYELIAGSPIIAKNLLDQSKEKDKNRFLLFEMDQNEHLSLGKNILEYYKLDKLPNNIRLEYNNEDIRQTVNENSKKWKFHSFLLEKRFAAENIIYIDITTKPPTSLITTINKYLQHPDKGPLSAHYIIHCVSGKRGRGDTNLVDADDDWKKFFNILNGPFEGNMFITRETFTTNEWSFIVITPNQWVQSHLLDSKTLEFVEFNLAEIYRRMWNKGVK